jgi:hypothetical protein
VTMAIAARLGTAAGSIAVSARYVCGTGIRGMATVPTRIPIADVGAQLPAEWSIVSFVAAGSRGAVLRVCLNKAMKAVSAALSTGSR